MTNKKGVTMVVIAATVIIAIIILSVSIATIGNSVRNANLVSFKEELTTVYQEVLRYYSLTGDLPKLDEQKYTLEQISNLSSNSEKINNEIVNNGENEDSYFVKIDLSKLEIERAVRGTRRDGENGKDVFVVNYPSFNVYYLDGFREGNEIYFSLSSLSNLEKFKSEDETLETIKLSGDLKVKKNTNSWSNKLNIEILTYMENGESLTFTLPQKDTDSKTVAISTESLKTNQITLETLNLLGFSNQEIQKFNELSLEDKKVEIKKQVGDVVTGNVVIDLFNYDSTVPTSSNAVSKSSFPEYNTFTFGVNDTLSGVKSIKYQYYQKLDGNITELYIDNESMYTKENILKNGKEEKINGDTVTLKIPKNITSVKYLIIDKAGNTTDVLTLDTKYPIHIKYSTVSGTNSSITFNASVDTTYTLTSLTSAISINGTTYTAPYSHGTQAIDFTYTDITGMNDYIYIKLVAVADSITETRIVKIPTTNFTKEGTTNKTEANSNNPYIPEGFVHTIGSVKTGFVIQDVTNTNNKYNEFVWIPVEYIKNQANNNAIVENSATLSTINDFRSNWKVGTSLLKSTIDTEPISVSYQEPYVTDTTEYENLISSIQNYGGFYVGRYEAGSQESRNSSSQNDAAIVRKNAYPYNYIKLSNSINDISGGAVEIARNMYSSSSDVKSHLMYGIEWDAVMYFISIFEKNVSNSYSFGNYTSSSINITGTNDTYSTANIYDLAGNLEEWTMEVYAGSTRLTRGGNISLKAAANRNYEYALDNVYENVGFRPALYIVN